MPCEILSLISGKGGVGKTSIAVNMAHFLAEAGLKVLLIDCDIYTGGATLFYELMQKIPISLNECLVFQRLLQSVLDAKVLPDAVKNEWLKQVINIEDNLDFIPSTDGSNTRRDELHLERLAESKALFKEEMQQWVDIYQIIILDLGAGENDLLSFLLDSSTTVMIVGAPNHLSEQSTYKIYGKAYNADRRIVYCINKVPEGKYSELIKSISLQPNIVRCIVGYVMDDSFNNRITTGNYLPTGLTQTGYRMKAICCEALPVYNSKIEEKMSQLEKLKRENEEKRVANYFRWLLVATITVAILVTLFVMVIMKETTLINYVIGLDGTLAILDIFFIGFYYYRKRVILKNTYSAIHERSS